MHNLSTVLQFEIIRTLKKKSFWVMALAFPLVICAVIAIIFLSNQATDQAAEKTKDQHFSVAIGDQSGLVNSNLLTAVGGSRISDKTTGIQAVQSGKLDAYFFYPPDLNKANVEIYGHDVGLFDNSRYEAVAKSLIEDSVKLKVDPQTTAILQSKVNFASITYKDGREFDGFKELIAPGIFLVLFYILITMFGNQMLTSTIEEKENRVIEMILTTIEARVLIIGKIIALIVLAFIQVIVILIPIIVLYALLHDKLALPSFDLSNIPLNPGRIALGAIIFGASFLLFTGLLVAIGAASPTAKEASGFFGIVMTLIFGPLYAVTLFVSSPDSSLVKFLSLFPLTAPIPLMLRNAVGNLSPAEAAVGITLLIISAILVLALAIRIFRYGTLEYSKRINVLNLLRRSKLRR